MGEILFDLGMGGTMRGDAENRQIRVNLLYVNFHGMTDKDIADP